ncbi:MAG: tannase/feruloyl esterase family alpha/beta hydrolase [Croceibacterium sp.]
MAAAAFLGGLCGASPALAQPAEGTAASRCTALAGESLSGLEIVSAQLTAAGAMPRASAGNGPPALILLRHCLVQGVINRRVGAGGRAFGIKFELRMPTEWNGRFLFQGGAGLDGVVASATGTIPNSAQAPALVRGFAVVTTDAGHSGSPVDASFATDQQARVDYGYNAIDKVTLAAKSLMARFYGRAPQYSYFIGCSNGGRQALTASQRLPLYFDGIVAGDPTIRFSRVALDEIWNLRVLARIAPQDGLGRPIYSRAISDANLKLVHDAVLKRCDAKDGLADGMINDWQACDFDPAVLACKRGAAANCLAAGQVQALRDLHSGPRTRDGKALYGRFNYDTGISSAAWRGMRLGTSDTGAANAADATLGLGGFRYFQLTPPDPGFDPAAGLNLDQLLERIGATASIADADNPYLETFAGRGKMILYNGLSDQGLASSVLVDWYDRMLAATGPRARDSVRLFLIPGMLHCGGGEATDRFETLDAIMDWVERAKAPDRITASSSRGAALKRPLCPYPAVARYAGGDANLAESFVCSPSGSWPAPHQS